MKKVPLAPDVNARVIARGTPGFLVQIWLILLMKLLYLQQEKEKRMSQ